MSLCVGPRGALVLLHYIFLTLWQNMALPRYPITFFDYPHNIPFVSKLLLNKIWTCVFEYIFKLCYATSLTLHSLSQNIKDQYKIRLFKFFPAMADILEYVTLQSSATKIGAFNLLSVSNSEHKVTKFEIHRMKLVRPWGALS